MGSAGEKSEALLAYGIEVTELDKVIKEISMELLKRGSQRRVKEASDWWKSSAFEREVRKACGEGEFNPLCRISLSVCALDG